VNIKIQLAELAIKRRKLLVRIETQRLEVAVIHSILKICSTFRHRSECHSFISRHPVLAAGSFAVILTLWRKGIAVFNAIIPAPIRFALSTIISTPGLISNKQDDLD